MQVTFVLDCSNCMLDYVKHFKNQVLKLVQEQTIKMEIAFVIYRANDDNNATSVATEVKSYGFKPSGSHKSDIFPPLRETTPLDKTSLLPIDVHSALAKALDFQWDPNVEKRILILIAKIHHMAFNIMNWVLSKIYIQMVRFIRPPTMC
eukprot:666546_1